jgi:hypothetical protein
MLKQLANLTIDADGRYATDAELKFIHNYLNSVKQRVEIYEKIRDSEEAIVEKVKSERKMFHEVPGNFSHLTREQKEEFCTRDLKSVMRCSAAAILLEEPDRLREALLLWYCTIVRAFNYLEQTQLTYQVLEKVMKTHFTPEEVKLATPILRLNHTILCP